VEKKGGEKRKGSDSRAVYPARWVVQIMASSEPSKQRLAGKKKAGKRKRRKRENRKLASPFKASIITAKPYIRKVVWFRRRLDDRGKEKGREKAKGLKRQRNRSFLTSSEQRARPSFLLS